MDANLATARPTRLRRRSSGVAAAVLGGVLLLAACGGDDAVDPSDADTGFPVESVPADPAATPAASDDPLTGSEP